MATSMICLNKRREHFREELPDLDVSSRPRMRAGLESYSQHNPTSVLLVDASKFTYDDFGLFLKFLEDPTARGSIWFYNLVLSKYPLTVRSRCIVVGIESHLELIQEFLRSKKALSQDNYRMMLYLCRYPTDVAWTMVEDKGDFMSFLVDLHQATPGNFYILLKRVTEDKTISWLSLLYEWMAESQLFTKPELQQCPWMRSEEFKKSLDRLVREGLVGTERHVFEFLIVYRLIEVTK